MKTYFPDSTNTCILKGLCLLSKKLEDENMIDERNALASLIWKNKRNRKIYIVEAKEGVETWWDNQSRNWITYDIGEDGQWTGSCKESNYTGNQEDAAVSHLWALRKLFGI